MVGTGHRLAPANWRARSPISCSPESAEYAMVLVTRRGAEGLCAEPLLSHSSRPLCSSYRSSPRSRGMLCSHIHMSSWSWCLLVGLDLVGELSQASRHIRSVQGVVSLATTLIYPQNSFLGEDLQVTRDAGCVDAAAIAQTHCVLWRIALAQSTHQRESIDFTQRLQELGEFLYVHRAHGGIVFIFAQICKYKQASRGRLSVIFMVLYLPTWLSRLVFFGG